MPVHQMSRLRTPVRTIGISAHAGETLFLEGEHCDHVFELRSGVARGVSVSPDGDRQVTAFFFSGDQIGIPVTDHYRFTAEAVTDLVYQCHSRSRWNDALVASCQGEGRLLPSICTEQDPMFRRGLIISRHGMIVRVCAFLVSIIDRLPVQQDGAWLLPLPQVDIAAYLAITPESVCRTLRHLRERRAVAMPQRDRIMIIDRAAIERFASGRGC